VECAAERRLQIPAAVADSTLESLTTMDEVLYVARQPILDSRNRVYGDELLYRAAQSDQSPSGRPLPASARILSESIAGLDP